VALAPYEGPVRDLCLLLKKERNAWLARWLSGLILDARRTDLQELLPRDSWLVPVPLHWWRRLERGYNQAEALAEGLAQQLAIGIHKPLRRVAATNQLAGKSAVDRLRTMHDAFRVQRKSGLERRTVLLVDDILTTGATAGAAARALKQAGANHVIVVVVARTL
jgi:ComF family protein